nr:unnamed protein product [Spirometra erinaceieuropaei]
MSEALHRILQTQETSDDPDAVERLAPEHPTTVESSQTTKKLAAKEDQSQQYLKKTAEVAPSFETTNFFEVHPEVDSVTTEGKR